jgi:hypothetical protein
MLYKHSLQRFVGVREKCLYTAKRNFASLHSKNIKVTGIKNVPCNVNTQPSREKILDADENI